MGILSKPLSDKGIRERLAWPAPPAMAPTARCTPKHGDPRRAIVVPFGHPPACHSKHYPLVIPRLQAHSFPRRPIYLANRTRPAPRSRWCLVAQPQVVDVAATQWRHGLPIGAQHGSPRVKRYRPSEPPGHVEPAASRRPSSANPSGKIPIGKFDRPPSTAQRFSPTK